jgi:hypothetical protein
MGDVPFFSVLLSSGVAVARVSLPENGRKCEYPDSLQEAGKNANPNKSKNTDHLFISKLLPGRCPKSL